MRTGLCLAVILSWELLPVAQVMAVRADDPPAADDSQAEAKKLNDLIERSIDWYELLPDADAKTPLRPQPVMRWRNVARGQAGEAMMVVWPYHGRPEAMASIYPWEGDLNH